MAITNRKTFLKILATALLGAFSLRWWFRKKPIHAEMQNSNASIGHQLRDSTATNPANKKHLNTKAETKVIIIGGGISGLSAARKLALNNIPFVLLELNEACGGNSVSGKNNISAFPWGAHYLPIPNFNQPELLNFLEEIEVIKGYDALGKPIYDEFALCAEPEERLFINKFWQEGIIPDLGLNQNDHQDIKTFLNLMKSFKSAVGSDQKEAFCIPIANSSKDEKYLELDKITMLQFLQQHKLNSKYLIWYLNYCCKDDFGTSLEHTSAWAGIHYFASRKGIAANAKSEDVLTWPEGNGFLVSGLKIKTQENILTNCLVKHVEVVEAGLVWVQYLNTTNNELIDLYGEHVILATPQYINKKILHNYPKSNSHFEYFPWLVANISTLPLSNNKGMEICWDNVIYNSDSLGYINACHQSLNSKHPNYVLTYYLPLCKNTGKIEREKAHEKTTEEWTQLVLNDLEKAHPDIREKVIDIKIKIWGHAMISPQPGVIWDKEKEKLKSYSKQVHFAHTDLSGISIFEEAFFQGTEAVKAVLNSQNS